MSKLSLNIYKNERDENGKRLIEKTYETDTMDILYAPIEDILNSVNMDKLEEDTELAKLIIVALKQIKPIMCDVFVGLTEAELRQTLPKEIVSVTLQILVYTVAEIMGGDEVKNILGVLK